MTAIEWIVLAAYGSLAVELLVFPIPSEASALQLVGAHGTSSAPALQRAYALPLAQRIVRYLVPTAACVTLFLLPMLVVWLPELRDTLAPMRHPDLLWPGVAMIVVGRVMTFASVLQLRAAKRREALPLGLFVRSRNPGLVGMFVVYLGFCLAVGGPWLWLGAPLYFGNMHARVKLEEACLAERFAASWQRYARRVPRYLPLPGLR
ncbi:MAG: hypothetical protein KAI24_25605 [Planctomycetes bacterium]|nr:hypothetical protein [Planctomycetota bacterium]